MIQASGNDSDVLASYLDYKNKQHENEPRQAAGDARYVHSAIIKAFHNSRGIRLKSLRLELIRIEASSVNSPCYFTSHRKNLLETGVGFR